MMTWLARCFCKHDWLIHFAPSRIYLQCQVCQQETTGWTV